MLLKRTFIKKPFVTLVGLLISYSMLAPGAAMAAKGGRWADAPKEDHPRNKNNGPTEQIDLDAPELTLPSGIVAEAMSADGSSVSYKVSARDAVDGNVNVSCIPVSGSLFAQGDTAVDCEAVDASGNLATGTFMVSVIDSTAPDLTVPSDMVALADASGVAVVDFTVLASDAVDGTLAVSCSPVSGSQFTVGSTSVSCSASDAAGNWSTGQFNVTVNPPQQAAVTVTTESTLKAGDPIAVSASVSAGAFPIAHCSLNWDGASLPALSAAPYQWDANLPGAEILASLTAGDHSAQIDCVDTEGMTSSAFTTVTVTEVVAGDKKLVLQWNTPTSRSDGSPLGIEEIDSYSVIIDQYDDFRSAEVLIIGARTDAGDLINEYTHNVAASGQYYFSMTALDAEGNMSNLSEIAQITVQ